jgi:hypothetical protein
MHISYQLKVVNLAYHTKQILALPPSCPHRLDILLYYIISLSNSTADAGPDRQVKTDNSRLQTL